VPHKATFLFRNSISAGAAPQQTKQPVLLNFDLPIITSIAMVLTHEEHRRTDHDRQTPTDDLEEPGNILGQLASRKRKASEQGGRDQKRLLEAGDAEQDVLCADVGQLYSISETRKTPQGSAFGPKFLSCLKQVD
jgi:hypothetical protein